MNELTMKGFLRASSSHYAANEAEYLLLKIEGNAKLPEIIINPRENFSDKIAYISQAYDDELRLKHNPQIRISSYAFLKQEELHYYF